MKRLVFALFLLPAAAWAAPPQSLVWDAPSRDHHGSMPLGNGDISVNAWVEPTGDLCFYIGKSDSWGDNARLLKVGKLRVTFDPPLATEPFRQELNLFEGAIQINGLVRLWVDAHQPVIHLAADRPATAAIELWRARQEALPAIELSDVLTGDPKSTPTVVEPDTILTGQSDRIGWYHRNIKSIGPAKHAEIQGVAGFPRADPLLHRTFGALITAPKARRIDDAHLHSPTGNFAIRVLTKHPATPEQWLAEIEKLPGKPDFAAHKQWWAEFWNRSWIRATAKPPRNLIPKNDHAIRVGVDQYGGNPFTGEIRNVRLPDDLRESFRIEAEVNAPAGATGRIFDKITPGHSDGLLLDLYSADTLRLIVGPTYYTVRDALPAGAWAEVVLTANRDGFCVTVDGKPVIITGNTDDAAHVSRMYELQRFVTACAGRGAYPIKFNGSLFTVPAEGQPGDADYRRWGPGYWWQNTRLPYFSMCASGDYEMQEPLWRMYVDAVLPLNKYRTKKYFGYENAAYYAECIHFWGDVFLESYGWTPWDQRADPLQESRWHKWEWVPGPELVWLMLENYDHTGDEALLAERIVPTADAVMRFFNHYYKANEAGQLVMHPAQAAETWWECTNPMPEVAGLRAVATRLLDLPETMVPAASRAYWQTFLAGLPPLPVRETPSGDALAPAEKFAQKINSENPELYAVFPFRLCAFNKPNRQLGVNALEHRWNKGNHGWRQDDLFMAYLGLTDEVRHYVVGRARSHDQRERFPAFWGPDHDWTPNQCHGGVLMKALQAMLLQTDGDQIFLLPAWPPEWDVDFKLHAPSKTTVEGKVVAGKLTDLKVIPATRRKDVQIIAPFSG